MYYPSSQLVSCLCVCVCVFVVFVLGGGFVCGGFGGGGGVCVGRGVVVLGSFSSFSF